MVSSGQVKDLAVPPGADENGLGSPSEQQEALQHLTLDDFIKAFSGASALPSIPEYFILYDPKFNPGDLHLYTLTRPRWKHAAFALDVQATGMNIEPIEKTPGMYRLRPATPLSKGEYYMLVGTGESATGTTGYLRPFCPQCDLASTQSAIVKTREEESARLSAATTPTKTIFQERVRVAPYGAAYYCTTCFWDLTVTDVDITWTQNPNSGVNRVRFADLQDIYWDSGWRCLKIPPQANSVCALQTSSNDEGKLAGFASTAKAALLEWRAKYPSGLPYAEDPGGD
jgi:hypothetical protein